MARGGGKRQKLMARGRGRWQKAEAGGKRQKGRYKQSQESRGERAETKPEAQAEAEVRIVPSNDRYYQLKCKTEYLNARLYR